jgi:putative transposase
MVNGRADEQRFSDGCPQNGESFWGTLKTECASQRYPSRQAARQAIFEYIEVWYNRQRRHSALAYPSPEDFEQCHL